MSDESSTDDRTNTETASYTPTVAEQGSRPERARKDSFPRHSKGRALDRGLCAVVKDTQSPPERVIVEEFNSVREEACG